MRRLLALALLLAACASPDAPDGPRPLANVSADSADSTAAPPADDLAARARAAGLTDAQAAALVALGVPVYVPNVGDAAVLTDFLAQRVMVDGSAFPEYELRYTRRDGTCLSVVAASEGLGDVFVMEPPRTRALDVPGVPGGASVPFGWAQTGDTADGWVPGQAGTEWIAADALYLRVHAGDATEGNDQGCPPAPPDAVAGLAQRLRPLDPADDALLIGPTDPVEEFTSEIMGAAEVVGDPEALALLVFAPTEAGEGRQATTARTLRRTDDFAVVLVTTTDQADDSVRDTRTRVVLMRGARGWFVRDAGEQRRCQVGRGSQEWTAGLCS